jgi:hypothetical protein
LIRCVTISVGHHDLVAREHLHASPARQLQPGVMSDEVHRGENQITGFWFANQWQ